MQNTSPLLTKQYVASGAIGGRRVVKLTDEQTAVIASAATDKVVGISGAVDAATTERQDVIHAGGAEAICGGTIAAGDLVTSDANGAVIVAAAAGGSNVRCVGTALAAGVSGDIIPVLVHLSMFQG